MRNLIRFLASIACALVLVTPAMAQDASESEAGDSEPADDDPMGGFNIGLGVGVVIIAESDFKQSIAGMDVTTTLPSRTDFRIGVPINLGGGGFGFDITPSIQFGDVTALGIYLGPAFSLGITSQLYIDLGVGLQAGYWLEDSVDIGLDLAGRVPVGVTYYVQPDLGLFGELGLGFGATGFKPKGPPISLAAAGMTSDPELNFGAGLQIDFSAGVRWP